MESEVFGKLKSGQGEEGELFLEGCIKIGGVDCPITLQSPTLPAETVIPWAEERHRGLLGKWGEVKQAVQDWIPEFYKDTEIEMVSDPKKMADALVLTVINYCLHEPGNAEIWFYSQVWDGMEEKDECALITLDITVYFDDKLAITDIGVDG